MDLMLHWPVDALSGRIRLPGSKSISNRLLVMQALSDGRIRAEGLSPCDDVTICLRALQETGPVIDVDRSGTAMRFLTAFFAATRQRKVLDGSARMRQRPIGELVEALNQIGAGIRYLGNAGYPPVQTSGRPLEGGTCTLSGAVSSQFISALLLISPGLPQGLVLRIVPPIRSASYIAMTIQLMQDAGVQSHASLLPDGRLQIEVPRQLYGTRTFRVEPDWSAASYWYAAAALSERADLLLEGLQPGSLQGDAMVSTFFDRLGVQTTCTPEGVRLTRKPCRCTFFEDDFSSCPDLVQTLAVTLCLLQIPFRLHGTESLHIKETDRTAALQTELKKLGYRLEISDGCLASDGRETAVPSEAPVIATWDDHRMALAFAPAAIRRPGLIISHAEVVDKSYPGFWEQLNAHVM